MAYTKAPVTDPHNIVRIPTVGSPIIVSEASSTLAQSRTLSFFDCFPRKETQWGKDPIRKIHKRDGWENSVVTGTTVTNIALGRSIVVCENTDKAYFARYNTFYKVSDITDLTTISIASQTTGAVDAWQSSGTLAIDSTNANRVVFLTPGGILHTWLEDGTSVTSTDLSALGINGFYGLVFMNGYLFAINPTNGFIYNSAVGGVLTTWNNTDFISPELYPDYATWIDKHKNNLVAFSNNSTEFFYDAAVEIGSPLARQESYASRIGIVHTSYPTKITAKVNDDIYFIGRNINNTKSLYRIRDFKVEEINNNYFSSVLNWVGSTSTYETVLGLETVLINNDPQILISLSNGYETVYNPQEDCWWHLRGNGDILKGYASNVNSDFPAFNYRIGGAFQSNLDALNRQLIFAIGDASDTPTENVYVYHPAETVHPTVVADIYTEVVDFGINYQKHFSRIDAVGDYGNNTLTLYYNQTPNYSQTYTACSPTRNMSTAGYGNNASWYNIGAYRRISLRLKLEGTDIATHDGFDIEYNVGQA